MSRLLIKQKVFSWTDTYDVYDEMGNPKYFVKADLFSIGHRIRVFEIKIGGRSQGSIKKQISFFHPKYNIDYKGWRLEGDFLQWNYDVYEQSRRVVHITKQLFQWGDTYVLDIAEFSDELPALMVAIAMDAARCSDQNDRNTMW